MATHYLENNLVGAEPESVAAYVAYAVYADYDGDAPDTNDLSYFSTEELAEEAAKIGNLFVGEHEDRYVVLGGTAYDLPFCDDVPGISRKTYVVHKVGVFERHEIRRSLAEWLDTESEEKFPASEL